MGTDEGIEIRAVKVVGRGGGGLKIGGLNTSDSRSKRRAFLSYYQPAMFTMSLLVSVYLNDSVLCSHFAVVMSARKSSFKAHRKKNKTPGRKKQGSVLLLWCSFTFISTWKSTAGRIRLDRSRRAIETALADKRPDLCRHSMLPTAWFQRCQTAIF